MTAKFIRLETMHGSVRFFNLNYVVAVRSRTGGPINEVGATIEIVFGQEVKTFHTSPGPNTDALLGVLGVNR